MQVTSFFSDIENFIKKNQALCIGTLGVAAVIYALGNLGGRVVSWIIECVGTTQKTNGIGIRHFNQGSVNVPLVKSEVSSSNSEDSLLEKIANAQYNRGYIDDALKTNRGITYNTTAKETFISKVAESRFNNGFINEALKINREITYNTSLQKALREKASNYYYSRGYYDDARKALRN